MRVNCPRCGEFNCPELFLLTAFNKPEPKISAWIRDINEQKVEVPTIDSNKIKDLKADLPEKSPREKQTKLLQNIERKTEYPGQLVSLIHNYDFPLAWASSEEELYYYITSLEERGFLKASNAMGLSRVIITPAGWDYLEQHDQRIEDRTQAFVAMSFKEDMKSVWQGPIFNAITKAGYKPYRVDEEPHINLIDVQIISAIKDSRFVVADFTHQNLGVYFETGYAQGMGLPVIRCVKEDDFDNLHFDKNHYNFIIWKTPEDLENQLYNYICAIIGKGKGN